MGHKMNSKCEGKNVKDRDVDVRISNTNSGGIDFRFHARKILCARLPSDAHELTPCRRGTPVERRTCPAWGKINSSRSKVASHFNGALQCTN